MDGTRLLADSTTALRDMLPWLGALLAAAIVGGVIMLRLRKWTETDAPAAGDDFTLEGLRRLHREGRMSDQEFEAARSAMVSRLKQAAKSADKTKPTSPRRPGGSADRRTDTD